MQALFFGQTASVLANDIGKFRFHFRILNAAGIRIASLRFGIRYLVRRAWRREQSCSGKRERRGDRQLLSEAAARDLRGV